MSHSERHNVNTLYTMKPSMNPTITYFPAVFSVSKVILNVKSVRSLLYYDVGPWMHAGSSRWTPQHALHKVPGIRSADKWSSGKM